MTTAELHRLHPSAAIAGHQRVSPWEAARLAEAQAQRMAEVGAAAPALFAVRSEINRLDDRIRELVEERTLAWRALRDTGARAFVPPFAPFVFWLLIGLMLLLEVPVNAAALDFLRLPQLESWMLALFFGLANLVAAKTTARALRQGARLRGQHAEWAIAAAMNLVLLIAVWHVAELRSSALDGAATASAFVALQLLFYVAALFLSFQQTDPSPAAEQATRHLQRVSRALDGAWRRRARLAGRHNVALERLRARLHAIEHECLRALALHRETSASEGGGAAPDWHAEPLSSALFEPLDFGEPLDEHPAPIGALLQCARRPA